MIGLLRPVSPAGEDPLVEGCTAHDLDSVAGVLKLYFRSLDPPLFPPDLFRELLASAGEAGAGGRPGGRGRFPVAAASLLLLSPGWRGGGLGRRVGGCGRAGGARWPSPGPAARTSAGRPALPLHLPQPVSAFWATGRADGGACGGHQAGRSPPVTHVCPQPGSVQRREHDGPLQPGRVLRADAAARARRAGPRGLAGPGEPAGADSHRAALPGFPTADPAARPHLREVHGTALLQLPGVCSSCAGEGGVQQRGAPSSTQMPRSDLRDAQLEGLVGENEPELEAGTLAQEDGEGGEKEDPILSPPWVPPPPPNLDPLFSPDLEGVVEAVACFAYTGRTAQELSFQRGDVLRLHERASGDWWRGECSGSRGLIPHKYITLPEG